MATSGYVDSWKTPSGATTTDGSNYSGAYYRWSWKATQIARGQTKISWTLQGCGRTKSPTWLNNECYIDIIQGDATTRIYELPWSTNQSTGDGTNTSFNADTDKSWRVKESDDKSFIILHDSEGNASFDVKIKASIWAGRDTGGTVTKTVTLEFNDPYYHVTYNANGGTGAPEAQNKTPGTDITLSSTSPSYTGKTFAGWGKSETDTDVDYDPGDLYTEDADIILYAIWLNNYTVSYNRNNFTVSSGFPSNQTKIQGRTLTLSSNTPVISDKSLTGYTVTFDPNGGSCSTSQLTAGRTEKRTFKNWNTKPDGTGTVYPKGSAYTTNSAATLYLQTNNPTYTTAAISLPTATRAGYEFLGWAKTATAVGGTTGSYTPTSSLTLFAIWAAEGLVYIDNGTTYEPHTIWIDNGSSWDQYMAYIDNGSSWELYTS